MVGSWTIQPSDILFLRHQNGRLRKKYHFLPFCMSALCCCLQVCYDLTRRVFNSKMSYLLFTVVFGSRGDYSASLKLSRFRLISARLQIHQFSLPICKGAKNICGDWGRFCHYVNVVLWNHQSKQPKMSFFPMDIKSKLPNKADG